MTCQDRTQFAQLDSHSAVAWASYYIANHIDIV